MLFQSFEFFEAANLGQLAFGREPNVLKPEHKLETESSSSGLSGGTDLKESGEFVCAGREFHSPVANLIELQVLHWLDQPAYHYISISVRWHPERVMFLETRE